MGFLYFSLSRRNKTSRILKACLTYMNILFIYCISKFLYEAKNFVMAFKVSGFLKPLDEVSLNSCGTWIVS